MYNSTSNTHSHKCTPVTRIMTRQDTCVSVSAFSRLRVCCLALAALKTGNRQARSFGHSLVSSSTHVSGKHGAVIISSLAVFFSAIVREQGSSLMTAGVDLMALAEGSDSAKVLDRNLSDLRGNALSKDRLSIFNQETSYESIPKPSSPKSPGKVWTRPTSTIASPASVMTPVSPTPNATKMSPGFLSAQSSVSAQPEHSSDTRIEEPKSPRLADNPFLKRDSSSRLPISPTDKLSDKSEPSAKSNEDVPRRGSIQENMFLQKDRSSSDSSLPSTPGGEKKTTGAAGVDQPRVARSPENSIAAARERAILGKSSPQASPQASSSASDAKLEDVQLTDAKLHSETTTATSGAATSTATATQGTEAHVASKNPEPMPQLPRSNSCCVVS